MRRNAQRESHPPSIRSPKVTTALVDELRDELASIAKHRVLLARQAKAMVAEQANYY
jgi:hypothetical protein